jgi:excisionase family DNA binding protein
MMADPRPLTPAERANERAERLLKVPQAAILLNYSDRHVLRLCHTGVLEHRRMQNGAIRIPLTAVNAFKAHHEQAERNGDDEAKSDSDYRHRGHSRHQA